MSENNYSFIRAEKHLFAVYQTIYSNVDIELWFDWKRRLQDTMWTDNCYWIVKNNQKIAGVIINDNTVMSPFLIAPFCDRTLFWQIINKHMIKTFGDKIQIDDILDDDVNILLTFGYKVKRIRQMMCRPTDNFSLDLAERFYYKKPEMNDIKMISKALFEGYSGGIDEYIFGPSTFDDVEISVNQLMELFFKTDTLEQSIIVFDKNTDNIASVCIAGRYPNIVNGFSSIGDICVLPTYRNQGLAEFMLKYSISIAHKTAEVIKLCVTVGNSAESLYRKIGFIAGPKFSNMTTNSYDKLQ